MTTLYIASLDYSADERDVGEFFEKYGNVTNVKVVKDRDTGRPKGYGFVTFESVRDAEDACRGADGQEIKRRRIKIEFSNGSRGGFRGGRGGFRGGRGGGGRRSFSPDRREDRFGGGRRGSDRFDDRRGVTDRSDDRFNDRFSGGGRGRFEGGDRRRSGGFGVRGGYRGGRSLSMERYGGGRSPSRERYGGGRDRFDNGPRDRFDNGARDRFDINGPRDRFDNNGPRDRFNSGPRDRSDSGRGSRRGGFGRDRR